MGWFLLILGAFLALSYGCYWVAFYNPDGEAVFTRSRRAKRDLADLDRALENLPCETVQIRSRDGLVLTGRYYHQGDGLPLHIQFHGYRGSGVRDLSAFNALVRKLGHNALVVDQRAHGLSQGKTMTFGIMERWDCLYWARYARNRFGPDTPLFLSGVSMGGATVLMASELELPDTVAGIIADCPYSSPGAIIRKVCNDMRVPGWLVYPFITAGALLFGHFALWSSSALRAVGKAKVPILLIHGREDHYVPCSMSQAIFAASRGDCFLEIFPGAAHGGSCMTDMSRYERILSRFAALCLEKRENR